MKRLLNQFLYKYPGSIKKKDVSQCTRGSQPLICNWTLGSARCMSSPPTPKFMVTWAAMLGGGASLRVPGWAGRKSQSDQSEWWMCLGHVSIADIHKLPYRLDVIGCYTTFRTILVISPVSHDEEGTPVCIAPPVVSFTSVGDFKHFYFA